ncbi:MAG: phospholipid transport system substrate-binding protein [Motiliproteus sp.]|jgi:phospholipid transport system substrate-binding protein
MKSVSIQGIKTSLLLLLGLLSAGVMAPLQAAQEKPEQVINASYLSIQKLITDQVLIAGMPEQGLLELMENELGPVIDFKRISRKVMGKYARQASDDQLQLFNNVFKRTLVSTYSKGLDRLDELDTFEVESADYDARGIRASVGSTIALKGGERYQVQYSLFLNDQEQWKVENLVVEGINIGLVFRNQFAHYMEQYDDISKVIANWGVTKAQ